MATLKELVWQFNNAGGIWKGKAHYTEGGRPWQFEEALELLNHCVIPPLSKLAPLYVGYQNPYLDMKRYSIELQDHWDHNRIPMVDLLAQAARKTIDYCLNLLQNLIQNLPQTVEQTHNRAQFELWHGARVVRSNLLFYLRDYQQMQLDGYPVKWNPSVPPVDVIQKATVRIWYAINTFKTQDAQLLGHNAAISQYKCLRILRRLNRMNEKYYVGHMIIAQDQAYTITELCSQMRNNYIPQSQLNVVARQNTWDHTVILHHPEVRSYAIYLQMFNMLTHVQLNQHNYGQLRQYVCWDHWNPNVQGMPAIMLAENQQTAQQHHGHHHGYQ